MNKLTLLLLLFMGCLSTNTLQAQLQIERQVIAAMGSLSNTADLQISATVGEIAIASMSAGDLQLTQGFQQSSQLVSAVIDIESGVVLNLYPNPTIDFAALEIELPTKMQLRLDLVDLSGRLISSNTQQLEAGIFNHRFDLRRLPAATYFINIISPSGSVLKTMRLVRI